MSDSFQLFVEECGLRLTVECLGVAPRDVLAPLALAEQHFLATVSRLEESAVVRLIYITPLTRPDPPQIRDVLWWMASDAWAIEHAQRDLEQWAASFGYEAKTAPAARVFEQHVRQADALSFLLGSVNYQRLLSLYDRDVGPKRVRPDADEP